tara:strand:- start:111 stop:1136 length:1026 start_codon:yes stop_codon:yes gene_type:complete
MEDIILQLAALTSRVTELENKLGSGEESLGATIDGWYPLFIKKENAERWLQENVTDIIRSNLHKAQTRADYIKMKEDSTIGKKYKVVSVGYNCDIEKSTGWPCGDIMYTCCDIENGISPILTYIYNGIDVESTCNVRETSFGSAKNTIFDTLSYVIRDINNLNTKHKNQNGTYITDYHNRIQLQFPKKYTAIEYASTPPLEIRLGQSYFTTYTTPIFGVQTVSGRKNQIFSLDFHTFSTSGVHSSLQIHTNDSDDCIFEMKIDEGDVKINNTSFEIKTIKTIQIHGEMISITLMNNDKIEKKTKSVDFLPWALSDGKRVTYQNFTDVDKTIILKTICLHGF